MKTIPSNGCWGSDARLTFFVHYPVSQSASFLTNYECNPGCVSWTSLQGIDQKHLLLPKNQELIGIEEGHPVELMAVFFIAPQVRFHLVERRIVNAVSDEARVHKLLYIVENGFGAVVLCQKDMVHPEPSAPAILHRHYLIGRTNIGPTIVWAMMEHAIRNSSIQYWAEHCVGYIGVLNKEQQYTISGQKLCRLWWSML